MSINAEGRRALEELFLSSFNQSELVRFLRYGADGEQIIDSLPYGAPLGDLTAEAVSSLARRGLINADLFARLLIVRPHRSDEIDRVWHLLQSELGHPERGVEKSWDFFISYSHTDSRWASVLHTELEAQGFRPFIDQTDIDVGAALSGAINEALKDSHVALALVSRRSLRSRWHTEEIAHAAELARRGSLHVVPLLLEDVDPLDLPRGLRDFKGLRWVRPDDVGKLIGKLMPLVGRPLPFARLEAPDSDLLALTHRFLTAAGRRVRKSEGTFDLSIPEPVKITPLSRPDRATVHTFGLSLRPGEIGYFVHRDGLPLDTEAALDTLRLQGMSIVPISSQQMRAALQDDNARTVLHTLTIHGRGGDDLFRTRNALIDRRFVFGRSELLARIGSAVGRGEQVLLTGSRKSGKTSFLNILRQDMEKWPVAFLDLQRYSRQGEEWVSQVFEDVVAAYDRWGQQTFGDWPSTLPVAIEDGIALEKALEQRRKWHAERGPLSQLILILDELERLLPVSGETAVARDFIQGMGVLRALAQGNQRYISIIAADLRPAANRRNDLEGVGTNPLFRFFQEVPLPLLTSAAIEEMIHSIGRMMGIVQVQPDFVQRLYALSGGHPYVARAIAGAASEHCSKPETLALADLERGLKELEDDDDLGDFFRQNFWGALTSAEKRYVAAIASGLAPPTDPEARASLKQQGLVIKGKIPIGAFADWVRSLGLHDIEKRAAG